MAWYFYVLLIGAGFLCGAINTLAGSGSLITLPVLIFLGLPPTVANGSNRIGILLQNISGSLTYSRRQVLDLRGALLLSAPALLGSLLGASIAVNLNEELMQRVIAGVMVVMLFVIWLKPQRWLEGTLINLQGAFNWQQGLALFAIGVYGGFIQAGVGIFLLATLVLSVGYDLVRANAVKVFIVLVFTVSSLLIFANNNQVDWTAGLLLGLGSMLGAWLAARVAVKRGTTWVRWVLMATVALAALYLFGAFDALARLAGVQA